MKNSGGAGKPGGAVCVPSLGGNGVTLAAIQGLYGMLLMKDVEIADLQARLEALDGK